MIKDKFFKLIEPDVPESTMLHYLYSIASGNVIYLGADVQVATALLAGVEVSGGRVTQIFPIQPDESLTGHPNFNSVLSNPERVLLNEDNDKTISLLVVAGMTYDQVTMWLERFAYVIQPDGLIVVTGVMRHKELLNAVDEFTRSRKVIYGLRDFQGAGVAVIRG